jgi:hypothetical protein
MVLLVLIQVAEQRIMANKKTGIGKWIFPMPVSFYLQNQNRLCQPIVFAASLAA